MREGFAAVLGVALLVALASIAPAKGNGSSVPPGQIECKEHTDSCGKKPKTVRDIDVRDGEEKRFVDGTFVLEGNVTVHDGGSFVVRNATVLVSDASVGFRARAGARLQFEDARIAPTSTSIAPRFAIVAEDASTFSFALSALERGAGMRIATDDASVESSALSGIPLALSTTGSNVVVARSLFTGNDVSVRFEGGSPTLEGSRIEGGTTCVHDYRTNPTIVGNVFVGCHTGIEHVESHSRITGNAMDDDGEPPGAGIRVLGSSVFADAQPLGVLIEGNRIVDYHSGIVVVSGRAFVRNNTVEASVLDGIRVEGNVAPMDVRGNVVRSNGGDGIDLADVANVTVADNVVEANAGTGLRIAGALALEVSGNLAAENALDGISIENAPAAKVGPDEARANAGTGFRLSGVDALLAVDLLATGNGEGGIALSGEGSATIERARAEGNAGHGFRFEVSAALGDVEILSPRAIGNGGDGLRNEGTRGVSVESGWFEDNAGFGARTLTLDAVVLAPLSWWGRFTGPTHALNPLGTGDEASDGIVYFPFLTSPPS